MLLFGEKLNSSIPSVFEIMKNRDYEEIKRLCIAQEQAGADYLDINTAILVEDELEVMCEIIKIAQENTGCNIMLDSPNVEVIREAAKLVERDLIINSITLDSRHELIDLAVEIGASLVALPIDEYGIGETEQRIEKAKKITEICTQKGLPREKLYIDAVIESVAVNPQAAKNAIDTVAGIKAQIDDVKTTCGLSNISFGLPKRININTAFIPAIMYAGLDSAIIDVLSPKTMDSVTASRVITTEDEYCMGYIERFNV